MSMAMLKLEDLMLVKDPARTKIKFNIRAGTGGPDAYDLLLEDTSPASRWYQMNAWKTKHASNNLNKVDYLLTFAKYCPYGNDYFIFGGMYKVEKLTPEKFDDVGYKLTLLRDNEVYIKRLIVKLNKPIGKVYNWHYESALKCLEPVVYEYSMNIGNLGAFPGYKYVNINYKKLQEVIASVGSDWYGALNNVKGVYCITDHNTGKLYVGSASGDRNKDEGADMGIWQRWSAYANAKDPTGGNKEFKRILSEKGLEYIEKNFTYSILEICDPKMRTDEVCNRESHWKDVLCSRKFGMNCN